MSGPATLRETPTAKRRESEPDDVRAALLRDFSRYGIPLAFQVQTDNGGWRMVFAAGSTLELRLTRERHAYLITGYGAEPYSAAALERAVSR
jgi:hypothetical protein